MYRAVFANGRIECAAYERDSDGVRLLTETGDFLAFVPYDNLHVLVDQETHEAETDPGQTVL